MQDFLWKKLIAPLSKDKDGARREFILNILLSALIVLSATAFSINIHSLIAHRMLGESPFITGFILSFFIFSLFLSRKGKSYLAAFIFISLLCLTVIYSSYKWGVDLQVNLLLFALIIIMSGILLGTRPSFLITIFTAGTIILFSCLEIAGIIHPNRVRDAEVIRIADALVYVILLCIIAIVSWLFNREGEKALKRARVSELALKKQRDNLEIIVEERTKELKKLQTEKLTQLYRFAEFGRMASGLFHDLASPLGLVSLNLDKLSKKSETLKQQQIKKLLHRAMIGSKQLENYVIAARQQMQHDEVLQTIFLKEELAHVIQLLSYKAKKAHVEIFFHKNYQDIQTFGNQIKFNQCVINLLANAIDAYDALTKTPKRIDITLQKTTKHFIIRIQDWGIGIQADMLSKIFDPLFTTKSFQKGTGMGLTICKDIIEKDFSGKIQVKSKKHYGTTFTVTCPIKQTPTGVIKIEKTN